MSTRRQRALLGGRNNRDEFYLEVQFLARERVVEIDRNCHEIVADGNHRRGHAGVIIGDDRDDGTDVRSTLAECFDRDFLNGLVVARAVSVLGRDGDRRLVAGLKTENGGFETRE